MAEGCCRALIAINFRRLILTHSKGDKHGRRYVLRDVYLTQEQDSQLRQIAHEFNVSKGDLLRAAIASSLAGLDNGFFNSGRFYANVRFQGYEGQTDSVGNEVRSDRLMHPGLAATLLRSIPKRQRRTKALTAQ